MSLLIKTPAQWNLTKDRVLVDGEIQRVAPIIEAIVEHSFTTHPMRNRTVDEHKRRAEIATRTYFSLRANQWTEARAVSHLRQALNAALDMTQFNPVARTSYARDPFLFPDAGPRPAIALIDSAQGD